MGHCRNISMFALLAVLPAFAAPDWSTLNRAIVRVQAVGKQTATGIVISVLPQEIRIATAKHVLESGGPFQVYFSTDSTVPFKATALEKVSDELDLAVLQVTEKIAGRPLPANIPRIPSRDGAFLKA